MSVKGPNMRMFDEIYASMGIDPKTGKPIKGESLYGKTLFESIRKQLRVVDEQDAVSGRYKWYRLPANLSGEELERLLYYRGSVALFYFDEINEFFFLPYVVTSPPDGSAQLDLLGRPKYISPLPIGNPDDMEYKAKAAVFGTKKYKVAYSVHETELTLDDVLNTAVIFWDYTKQYSQTNIIPRQQLNDSILELEAVCFPYLRTALKNSTGVAGIRVGNEDESANVYAANKTIDVAAIEGDKFVPIQGTMEMQELAGGNIMKCDEFMLSMQSMDNYRLSLYGIDNGGLFTRNNEYTNNAEIGLNKPLNIPLQNGLDERQNSCTIANSIWGVMMWCLPRESAIGTDTNADGVVGNENEFTSNEEVTDNE